ncbi:UV radiation resistance protein and autophagy-related subunit 14-domain-containing protein, partial [Phellopilus nigrolimitatus]
MECHNCEQRRREFICASCLGSDLRDHRSALTHLTAERDALVAKAAAALSPLEAARGRRADVAALRSRLDDIQTHTKVLRVGNDNVREHIGARRAAVATRRQTLDDAYRTTADLSPARTPTPTPPGGPPRRNPPPSSPRKSQHDRTQVLIDECTQAHCVLQDALAHARQGLVQELVDVFAVVEVGGRPAAGVRAATRGEWAIGGLVLPVPGDMRRYPPAQINAALTFTIHFLGLLTFYLGIRLPFQITWSGGKIGVGIPEICAGKGSESGGWARWTVRNPLHLPLSSSSTSPAPFVPSSPPSSPRATTAPYPPYPPAPALSASMRRDSLSSSTTSGSPVVQTSTTPASFPTALAMLLYSVAYLAHTQGADVPLAGAAAGEVLRNLWGVCCSAELGRRSHATHPALPPPTPPSFTLDFRQLLQATAAGPAGPTPRTRQRKTEGARRDYVIAEEEDGWEVVD